MQIVATLPLPHADGEAAEPVAGRPPSAALEITDRVVAAVGEIGQPALEVGEAAVAEAVGAVAVAASVAVVSEAAAGGDPGDMFGISADVQQKTWPSTMKYNVGGWECRTSR